jgi:hypothetical protein
MAIPTNTDAALVDWSTNADTRLNASPVTYGTTAAIATQYSAVHDPYVAAVAAVVAAREAGTRSSSLIATRNQARTALLNFARPLYKQIQANTAVTNAAKIELGVKVPDVQPTPGPIPNRAPIVRVDSVDGRVFNLSLRDPNDPDRKRMPIDVNGAIVMSYIGATAPTDPSAYTMQGPTSRTSVTVILPDGTSPGTQVWFTAVFFNERKQMGPACAAVGAQVNFGGSMPMAA